MNLYKEWPGIQEDITWSDINYTPFANRAFIHKLGKALSGNSDFILEGCAFSKIAGTSASVTAGYVFDETSGEVVQVDAQTVAETLGTNNWTLVKTTTYDPAGNNTYRTGGPNDNYQQERMVLTNVVSVGSGFDVENAFVYGQYKDVPDADITVVSSDLTLDAATYLKICKTEKNVHVVGQFRLDFGAGWAPSVLGTNGESFQLSIPNTYFTVGLALAGQAVNFAPTSSTVGSIMGAMSFSDSGSDVLMTFALEASKTFTPSSSILVAINCLVPID